MPNSKTAVIDKTVGDPGPEPKAETPAPAKRAERGTKDGVMLFTNPPQPRKKKGDIFNTFRVGKKWAERVEVGDKVTLAKTEDAEFETVEAEVVSIHSGPWDRMKALATDNHEYGQHGAVAAELLHDDLKRHYGGDFDARSIITVLYLKLV